jgi:tetratricopeptide (TPR) repeat protein
VGRHYSRGLLFFDFRRYREAFEAFTDELADDPNSAPALAMRASCLLHLSRPRDAAHDICIALGLAPDFAFAHYILSYVRHHQGRIDLADEAIREALRLDQEAAYFYRLGELLMLRNRLHECRSILQEALSLNPMHVPSLLLHGKLMTRLGRYREAKQSLLDALSINPEQPTAHLALGTVTLQIGQPSEARDALREARRLSPVTHHDRKALAVAYGRLLWPFRFVDQFLIRFPSWTPSVRWCLVALTAAIMLLITLALAEHAMLKAAVFSIVLNLFLAPISFDMTAHAIGKIAYRRDLDIPWPMLFPELLRLAFPIICHVFATWLAFACARSLVLAVVVAAMLPHSELVLIIFRQMNNNEPSDAGLAYAGIVIPILIGFYAWFEIQSIVGLVIPWIVSLVCSHLLTVHYRSSAIQTMNYSV